MSLQLSFSVSEKCTTLTLKGSLNEHSSALDGVEVNPGFDLHIDLKGLQGINSLGIRNFQKWISQVKSAKLKLFYCPRSFIHQLNMIDQFVPDQTEIESFFVPYYSDFTGEDVSVLFTKHLEYRKTDGKIVLKMPQVTDSQGNKMDLDIVNDQYFRFLEKYY